MSFDIEARAVNDEGTRVVLRGDRDFAVQLTQSNTIYEVGYNYDLKGKTVTIPEGCSLYFVGGKLKSGTIRGKNTEIIAGKRPIFESVKIEGTWNVDVAYPEWFGAKGNGEHDDREAIQACIDAPFSKIVLQNRATSYMVSMPLSIKRPIVIEGDGGNGTDTYAKIKASKKIDTIFVLKTGCVRSHFSNLYLDGNNICGAGFYSPQEKMESYLYVNTFTNVKVVFSEYGFRLNKLYGCVFNSCQANSISKIGFCFNKDLTDGSEGTTITAINCGSSTWHSKGGIGWYFNKLSYCNLISCGSDQNEVAYEFKNCSNFSIIGCGCEQSGTPMVFDKDGYSMGFTVSSFRITDLKKTAPYDWLVYSGGLYNTTFSGVYVNTKNKRAGDIYTRYSRSSIVVLDKSFSPARCTNAGTAVLFPSLQVTKNSTPAYEGQIYVDKKQMALSQKENEEIVWKKIYDENLNQIDWSKSNAVSTSGGYREFENIVFVNAKFTSKITAPTFYNIAVNLPMNELGETNLRITDNDGNEVEGVVARISSSTLQISGLKRGARYCLSGFYFKK